MEKETIIILPGFGRTEFSYKGIVKNSPSWIDVKVVPWDEFSDNQEKNLISIQNILKKFDLNSAHFVCHSLGGVIGMELAANRPDFVKTLILIGSMGIKSKRSSLINNTIIECLTQAIFGKTIDNFFLIIRLLIHPIKAWKLFSFSALSDETEMAQKIKVPTFIFWTSMDKLTPVSHGEKLHSLIQNSKFIVIAGYDHDWILYNQKLFWREYLKYENS